MRGPLSILALTALVSCQSPAGGPSVRPERTTAAPTVQIPVQPAVASPAGGAAAEARAVADRHYACLEAGDWDGFVATVAPINLSGGRRGTTGMWFDAGRKMVEQHGVHYVFDHVEAHPGPRYKVFYRRIHPDGSQRGMPLPCTVTPEDGRWLVYSSTQ